MGYIVFGVLGLLLGGPVGMFIGLLVVFILNRC